jgi:ABC-type transport system involved in cytochrome c biogenesis permease subunit
MKQIFFAALILLFATYLALGPARANDWPLASYDVFAQLPVLEGGRIKPLDTLAREKLRQFSGQEFFQGRPARAWLADAVFDPAGASEAPIFHVADSEVRAVLGLAEARKQFSLIELEAAILKAEAIIRPLIAAKNEITPAQKALVVLHDDVVLFKQLLRSFSLLLPLNVKVPKSFDVQQNRPHSYLDLVDQEPAITAGLRKLMRRKGEKIETYTPAERDLAFLSYSLKEIAAGGTGNQIMRVLPNTLPGHAAEDAWVTPWMTRLEGKSGPGDEHLLTLWQDMATAYRDDDAAGFMKAAAQIQIATQPHVNTRLMQAEYLYHLINPLWLAMLLYGAALAAAGAAMFLPVLARLEKLLLPLMIGGVLLHGLALAARLLILQRPPVGTLYESVLFVAFICAAGVSCARSSPARPYIRMAGALAGFVLLLVAPSVMPKGESMEMLVAVLNTNFWLATHVVCITAGYGVCVLTAILAHVRMGMVAYAPRGAAVKSAGLVAALHGLSILALLLTTVGTILGGIWADQSWGRFWGWDPKENGALLIVLWLVWLQHGRLSGHISLLGFHAGLAFLNVIVALSWFGVNLLGVGLHAYGFTSGLAEGLAVFCTLQSIVIALLWFFARARRKERVPA